MACVEIGEWVDAIQGKLPSGSGYPLVRHASRCASCREGLDEARRMNAAFGARGPSRTDHLDLVDTASALAREEVPGHAWQCEACFALVLESARTLSASDDAQDGPRASRATRRRLHEAAGLAEGRSFRLFRPFPMGALAAAAAAALFGVVWLGPSGEPWAAALELDRGTVWRLPANLSADTRRTFEGGLDSAAVFDVPVPSAAVERDVFDDASVPVIYAPRWEAVLEDRPTFVWSAPDGADRHEVFLLDSDKRFLWSRESTAHGAMAFPDEEAPLERGQVYFWKVNRYEGDRVLASPYAGLRVLDRDERDQARRLLDRFGSEPFLTGVVCDRYGLYTAAATAFDDAAEALGDPAPARRAAAAVRAKQEPRDE